MYLVGLCFTYGSGMLKVSPEASLKHTRSRANAPLSFLHPLKVNYATI